MYITLTLKITTAQVVEKSVTVTNSSFQDNTYRDDDMYTRQTKVEYTAESWHFAGCTEWTYLWDTVNNVAHFPNSLGCIDVWEVMGMSVEQLTEAEGSNGITARLTDHHDGRIWGEYRAT